MPPERESIPFVAEQWPSEKLNVLDIRTIAHQVLHGFGLNPEAHSAILTQLDFAAVHGLTRLFQDSEAAFTPPAPNEALGETLTSLRTDEQIQVGLGAFGYIREIVRYSSEMGLPITPDLLHGHNLLPNRAVTHGASHPASNRSDAFCVVVPATPLAA